MGLLQQIQDLANQKRDNEQHLINLLDQIAEFLYDKIGPCEWSDGQMQWKVYFCPTNLGGKVVLEVEEPLGDCGVLNVSGQGRVYLHGDFNAAVSAAPTHLRIEAANRLPEALLSLAEQLASEVNEVKDAAEATFEVARRLEAQMDKKRHSRGGGGMSDEAARELTAAIRELAAAIRESTSLDYEKLKVAIQKGITGATVHHLSLFG